MTPRRSSMIDVLLLGAVAAGVISCGWCGWDWVRTSSVAAMRAASLAEARALVAEVEHARKRPSILADAPPSADPLTLVKDTLGQAGVAESVLRRVVPEADAPSERIEGVTLPIRKSGLRVELDGMTLPEIGRFLTAWRARNRAWTPVLLSLSPRLDPGRDAASTASSASEARWTVNMSAAALYLAASEPKSSAASDAATGKVPMALAAVLTNAGRAHINDAVLKGRLGVPIANEQGRRRDDAN